MNPAVDDLLVKTEKWKPEFERLRSLILEFDLVEDIKWGQPCYLYNNRNVVLIHGFKEYCALLFMKGALLKNDSGALIAQSEKVQASRQIRFASLAEIQAHEPVIRDCLREAIEVEKAGLKVEFKETKDFPLPIELEQAFDEDQNFRAAFYALTPGRQRAWILHFSEPKQSKTRVARIERNRDKILDGLGLND